MATNIAAVRQFNRFYTQKIGVLEENVYGRPLSLTEARVLYELANGDQVAASHVVAALSLDPGYISRIVGRFEKQKLVRRTTASGDRRKSVLTLTAKGAHEFARINVRSDSRVASMIGNLSPADQHRLVSSMQAIQSHLGTPSDRTAPFLLRPPSAGDFGWVVQRHGAIYAQEYGWNEEFEALVAEIVARFIRNFDAKRERCWIGESLVGECIRFARQHGYRKMMLWTNSVLHAAGRIYERYGFELIEEERQHIFGHDLVSQTWEVRL